MLSRWRTFGRQGRAAWHGLVLIAASCLAACAERTYQAAPIQPERVLGSLEQRSATTAEVRDLLADSGLDVSTWPPTRWTLDALVVVAVHYHPELAVARAAWQARQAAEITAGRRANPTLEPTVEHHGEPGARNTPWSVGLGLQIPFERSEKREARLAAAAARTEAAHFHIGHTAWQVRRRVRDRFVELFAAEASVRQLTDVLDIRSRIVGVLERRFAVGETDAVTLGNARLQRQQDRISLNVARRNIAVARAAIADAMTLPAEAVADFVFATGALDAWAPPPLPENAVRRSALLDRLDIGEALAAYRNAEARLRLAVANQYPDVVVGPGFLWDQGDLVWSVGGSILAPIFDVNEGPIAEAAAARTLEMSRFVALQSRVLGELDQALAAYAAAGIALSNAEALMAAQEDQLMRLSRQFQAGETGRLSLLEAELALVDAKRAVLVERVNALGAFAAVEDAVQRPFVGGAGAPRVPQMIGRSVETRIRPSRAIY